MFADVGTQAVQQAGMNLLYLQTEMEVRVESGQAVAEWVNIHRRTPLLGCIRVSAKFVLVLKAK